MTQPLPSWLKLVTLRYQDSDQYTTGLVELPIVYSGPSIPLAWPYTSIASVSPTAPPPLSSSAPLSPQVLNFIDGSGPFTVLGDVILTHTASIYASPTTSTSVASATPTPSVILLTTVTAAQPTANPTPSSHNWGDSPSKLLGLGFVMVLITLVVLLFAVSIVLIKCHLRRKNHVDVNEKNYDCLSQGNRDDSSPGVYLPDLEGSQAPQQPSCNLRDAIPNLLRQHASLNAEIREKKLIDPETQFLITPSGRRKTHAFRWARWKKLFTRLQEFSKTNQDREVIVYEQHLPQSIPHFFDRYHYPSVNTDTVERVSKWRMKCNSPFSPAFRLSSETTSQECVRQTDLKSPCGSLSAKDQASEVNDIEFATRNEYARENGVFSYNPTSIIRGTTGKIQTRDHQTVNYQPLTPSKERRLDRSYKWPECSSVRCGTINSRSDLKKKSIIPSALFKTSAHVSCSFGGTTGKKSATKRYTEDPLPLLIDERETYASESDETDPGSSPLNFKEITPRSPSRCRRGTSASSSVALSSLENPIDSICSSQPPSQSGSRLPLLSSVKRVRPKRSSLVASPRPSFSSPLSSGNVRNDHVSAFKLPPSTTSQILPLRPATPSISPKKIGQILRLKRANDLIYNPQGNNPVAKSMDHSTGDDSSLDHEPPGSDQAEYSREGVSFPVEATRTCFKFPMKHRIAPLDQVLIASPQLNIKKTVIKKTQHSPDGEKIIFNECSGSRPIGNTGGVSELGTLENNDIESSLDFPVSISDHPVPRSLPASSGIFDGDEYSCKSEELFYVKPQIGNTLGRRTTTETFTEARSDWEFTRNS